MSNTLNLKRLKILNLSKKYIESNGWNDQIFKLVKDSSKYTIEEMKILFPSGYKSLLVFYLENLNEDVNKRIQKKKLLNLKTHEKIKELILMRLKFNEKEKQLIKKTIYALMLPNNSKISLISLYKTIDSIWYLAGDNSTDFNYYSKRIILAIIYSNALFYWAIRNKSLLQTSKYIDKNLKFTSIIGKLKKTKISNKLDLKKFFSFINQTSNFKQ